MNVSCSFSPKRLMDHKTCRLKNGFLLSFRVPRRLAPTLGNTVERDLKLPGRVISEDLGWLPSQWRAEGALLLAVRAPLGPAAAALLPELQDLSAPQMGQQLRSPSRRRPCGCSAQLRTRFPRGPGTSAQEWMSWFLPPSLPSTRLPCTLCGARS